MEKLQDSIETLKNINLSRSLDVCDAAEYVSEFASLRVSFSLLRTALFHKPLGNYACEGILNGLAFIYDFMPQAIDEVVFKFYSDEAIPSFHKELVENYWTFEHLVKKCQ